jgi:hypothetical protein
MNRNLLIGIGVLAAAGAVVYLYSRKTKGDAIAQEFEAPSLPMTEDAFTATDSFVEQPVVVASEPLQQPIQQPTYAPQVSVTSTEPSHMLSRMAVPLKSPTLEQQAVTVEKSTTPTVSLEKSLTAFPAMGYLDS